MYFWQMSGSKKKNMTNLLNTFNDFLKSIDLRKYREKYALIKLVELDMPRHLRPIPLLYEEYWDKKRDFLPFEEFYKRYADSLRESLNDFRIKNMFSKETFHRGLPARIYRTWASLLTQIQGGYVAEDLYGDGMIEMSAELDYQGIDMRINSPHKTVNIQIKKETVSREVRTAWQFTRNNHTVVQLVYEVPGCEPFNKNGKEKHSF